MSVTRKGVSDEIIVQVNDTKVWRYADRAEISHSNRFRAAQSLHSIEAARDLHAALGEFLAEVDKGDRL